MTTVFQVNMNIKNVYAISYIFIFIMDGFKMFTRVLINISGEQIPTRYRYVSTLLSLKGLDVLDDFV